MLFDFYDHGICISPLRAADLSREPLNYFHSFPGHAAMLLRPVKLAKRTPCRSSVLSLPSILIGALQVPLILFNPAPGCTSFSEYFHTPGIFPSCSMYFLHRTFQSPHYPFSPSFFPSPFLVTRPPLSLPISSPHTSPPFAPFSTIYQPIQSAQYPFILPTLCPFVIHFSPSTLSMVSDGIEVVPVSRSDFTPPRAGSETR